MGSGGRGYKDKVRVRIIFLLGYSVATNIVPRIEVRVKG